MDFFRSVFSDDPEPEPADSTETHNPQPHPESRDNGEEQDEPRDPNPDHNPNPQPISGAWSFGGLVKTLASRSEAVIDTYRRDLEEFRSGLKKETAVIRAVARRAVEELPGSLEAGASVAQDSLESVGQVIDDFGSTVWRGTAEIISQGKDTLLAADHDSDYSSDSSQQFGNQFSNHSFHSKRYSRFEAQLRAIQSDLNTYCEEPGDSSEFIEWKSGFDIDNKGVEIENLFEENRAMEGIFRKLVPDMVDHVSFWARYFYRVHKLKEAEDARAKLVKKAISGEEEELTWDFDDEDDETSESNARLEVQCGLIREEEHQEKNSNHSLGGSFGVGSAEKSPRKENVGGAVVESLGDVGSDEKDLSETDSNKSVIITEEPLVEEGKAETAESCKDSDVSVVSTQPSLPEEEDLGWDEIEDIGSNDENKGTAGISPTNRNDLRKRLSVAEDDEDLSWDIEDDDEPVKS